MVSKVNRRIDATGVVSQDAVNDRGEYGLDETHSVFTTGVVAESMCGGAATVHPVRGKSARLHMAAAA